MNIHEKIIKDVIKQHNDFLEYYCYKNAVPKIKGCITPGKLKWRGIRLIQKNSNDGSYAQWLEQRGKRISPDITVVNSSIFI